MARFVNGKSLRNFPHPRPAEAAAKPQRPKTNGSITLRTISPIWTGQTAIVAATGPSLTHDVAEAVKGRNIVAVNDAYRLLPFAPVLYACDATWWTAHDGCPGFAGEKWSSHGAAARIRHNDKSHVAARYGLNIIEGADEIGFSADPARIHYGSNSGFQAVNLALLMGAARVILVGFDMRPVDGKRHFFGDHPAGLRNNGGFVNFIRAFDLAAKRLPKGIEILNATPASALSCFPRISLDAALSA